MAYKRELIVNNGSLTSYKKLLKVSDVCQLLDKSKYPATMTINGVTFTNNGDGTITANGTSTSETYSSLRISNDDVPCVKGHIYCILGCPSGGSYQTYDCNTSWGTDRGNGTIELFNRDFKFGNYFIRVFPGYTANNIVFKPQLFDLTEMYGAGNEPATVAEFKAKFPNDLYDYSPRCWVTSYKTGLIAKTKNLFNDIPVKTNTVIIESGVEESAPGYNVYSKIYGNDFTISTNAPIDLTATDNWLRVCLYNSAGAFIARKDFNFSRGTVVHIADNTMSYMQLCVSSYTFPNYKLQVEKGTTATDYVPYGYL